MGGLAHLAGHSNLEREGGGPREGSNQAKSYAAH